MNDVSTKWVYSFGADGTEGDTGMRNLLGGKGANLAEMSGIGLPVPPGFTITTEVCNHYYDNGRSYPDALASQVKDAIARIEAQTGARFADPENPLLVSVRSGARASMPGMMDTVLNLGLNDVTVAGLAARADDKRFAYDSYRRFIQMYSDVVMEVDHGLFEDALEEQKLRCGVFDDTGLTGDDLETLVGTYKQIVRDESGEEFPQDPNDQLWGAIGAVFNSWMNARATTYRRLNNIPASWGTAVNVQAMVFGNMGEDCATGVAFTRDPSTGENSFYGEYLINAQGEDVVAGIRTPLSLTRAARETAGESEPSMEEAMPEVFAQLDAVRTQLETHYGDMQDIEFTVQQNKLYMLQTRNGKRTGAAALRMAVEMAEEGLITREQALLRIDPIALDQLLHPTLDPDAKKTVITQGLPASPGAAAGEIVLSADRAEELAAAGKSVILVRLETSPEDIHGMHAAAGILTARGGMTSHAAVVARGMGRACVSGAGELMIFCGALVAASLGFLWFNAYPAQMFMGDVGSLPLGAAIGLLALVSFDPQDLSDVDGYVEDSSAVIPGGPNLANLLENAARNKNGVRLTEEQINNYIRRTLKFEQGGWFESFVTARGVWVRLQENIVEVIIEREVWGKRHTISMLLEPEQTAQEDGGINTTVSREKGKWGRAKVLNGFMLLTNSSFVSLREAYGAETQQIWDMFRGRFQIKVSDGVLELSPPDEPSLKPKA